VTAVTAILILIFHGKVSGAAAGLALSYAAQLAGIFQFTVRLATETEARFVSIERMKSFLDQSMPEEPKVFDTPNEKVLKKNPEKLLVLPSLVDMHPNWPVAGHVKFDSVFMSYSLEHEAVLRDLSFEVLPGQKIGMELCVYKDVHYGYSSRISFY
jgi:ATP-binding cassette subfamily C (CFTR/MRP) protein 5